MIRATIGRRTTIILAAWLSVALGLGLRSADPVQADPPTATARMRWLIDAGQAADAALTRLDAALQSARDHARRGTALTVSGDAPAAELITAAEQVAAAAPEADAARRAIAALTGYAAAIRPGVAVPVVPYNGTDLELIAAQMRSGADAATLFVERRHATDAIVEALAAALAALDRDDPAGALSALGAAGAPLSLLDTWEDRPPLLRYWMTISRELLEAAADIASATIADDPAAVAAAGARYAKAAEAARGADNALAFALSEAAAAISATPLRRLAAVADEVVEARAGLDELLQPAS